MRPFIVHYRIVHDGKGKETIADHQGERHYRWCAAKAGYLPVKLEQEGLTMTLKPLSRTPII